MTHERFVATLLTVICIGLAGQATASDWRPVDCGRIVGYKSSAKITFRNESGVHNLQLTYYDRSPPLVKVAAALKECVFVVVKSDRSMDILATAWLHLPGKSEYLDDQIDPFPPGTFFGYNAKDGTIGTRKLGW